jgi:UDP-glucose 4-epimerase
VSVFEKPSVLVTGGAGFIGSHVAHAYLSAGYAVTIVDDLSRGRLENLPNGARFVQADVRSREARELVATGDFTILNHHAAQVDVRRSVSDPLADASVNVLGLLNLLQGARSGKVKRIVFASSGGAIYADGVPLPVDEAAPKLPTSPYGVAKLACEYYLATFAHLYGVEAVALRYSNVYGPRQDPGGGAGVVAIFARQALAGKPLVVYGDGEQTRDMVHVADVAAANIAATECSLPPLEDLDGRAYNIGTGIETSVNQLAGLVAEVAGHTPQTSYAPRRSGEIRRSALIPRKAGRELAWRPQTSLIQGLHSTVRWLAEH